MHLNKRQVAAMQAVRDQGYNPVHAVVLTNQHRALQCCVVSVVAIQGGNRFNIRVGVTRNNSTIISIETLNTIIDYRNSRNPQYIDGCKVKTVNRVAVSLETANA